MTTHIKKHTKLSLLIVIVFIIIVSFTFLDFHLATLDTDTNSQISAYATGDPIPNLTDQLYVYVEGDDQFSSLLKSSLIEQAISDLGIPAQLINQFKQQYDEQTLVVTLLEKRGSYNPFVPSVELEAFLFYTFTGNSTYFTTLQQDESTPVQLGDSPDLLVAGRVTLNGKMTGIISYRAYQRMLANALAKSILDVYYYQLFILH